MNEWLVRQGAKAQETWRRALGEKARHLKLAMEGLAWLVKARIERVV